MNFINIRQKFTGYQRDEETNLDFAEARYYNTDHGRFTAVDPLLASGKSADPQTFNRYAYTMNRPLILTDPTGLQAGADLKKDFNLAAYTYKPITESRPDLQYRPKGEGAYEVPMKEVEVGRKDIVYTNDKVNEIVNKYASAVYTNEVIANSAIGSKNETGKVKIESVTLGTDISFGIKGPDVGNVSGNTSISTTIKITDNTDIDAERRNADTLLGVSAANALSKVTTPTTDSPDTPVKLSETAINQILQGVQNRAREEARKSVLDQEERRRNSEQIIAPRQ